MTFGKTVRNINRIGEVINILIKYSFQDIVASTRLKQFVSAQRQVLGFKESEILDFTRWERIRMVIEELGPTFVKLAQFLSNRPDVLPEALIKEFAKLQSNVPPFPTKISKLIIEKELKKKIDELFNDFCDLPIGSASISQVHKAKLKTGEIVVVKVQRPKAQKKVETDLRLLRDFVKLTENYFKKYGILNPLEIVETFEKTMSHELDFTTELKNIEKFKSIYHNEKRLHVPKPYIEFSTRKVLVMEYIDGCEITDVEQLKLWKLDERIIAERGINLYLKQIFEFGFFHADPHPGNILIEQNGTIALVDFGMMGKLTRRDKLDFAAVFIALSERDAKSMALVLQRLALDAEIKDMQKFESDLQEVIDDFLIMEVGQALMADLTKNLYKVIYNYKLQIPGSVFLIFRALAILEGIGKMIHPGFKTLDFIKPYGKKLIQEYYSIHNIKSEIKFTVLQFLSLINTAPNDLKSILKKMRYGEYKTKVELTGYDFFLKTLGSIANRIVFAFLISSLIIGSSLGLLIHSSQKVLTILEIPIYSFVGYSLAFILSIWLLLYTFRQRFKNQ
jgi:ubiquinone biosynthesis protein